ncbi:MAG TPA: hypothetical protein VNL92_05235 [Dehalococcoidia bacterium]|nr:hypothetical protein [Dehalococcoidia bacterium]
MTGKAALLHVAIGVAGGAAFGALPGRGAAPLLVGPAYGLAFYLVAIGLAGPSLGILPPMHRQSRTFLVRELLTHLVFGTTVASSVARAEQRR